MEPRYSHEHFSLAGRKRFSSDARRMRDSEGCVWRSGTAERRLRCATGKWWISGKRWDSECCLGIRGTRRDPPKRISVTPFTKICEASEDRNTDQGLIYQSLKSSQHGNESRRGTQNGNKLKEVFYQKTTPTPKPTPINPAQSQKRKNCLKIVLSGRLVESQRESIDRDYIEVNESLLRSYLNRDPSLVKEKRSAFSAPANTMTSSIKISKFDLQKKYSDVVLPTASSLVKHSRSPATA